MSERRAIAMSREQRDGCGLAADVVPLRRVALALAGAFDAADPDGVIVPRWALERVIEELEHLADVEPGVISGPVLSLRDEIRAALDAS